MAWVIEIPHRFKTNDSFVWLSNVFFVENVWPERSYEINKGVGGNLDKKDGSGCQNGV